MNPASLTVKQKIANGFVIFTAIWSSAIMPVIPSYAKMLDNNDLPTLGSDNIITEDNTERLVAEYSKTLGTFLSQKKKTKDLSDMAQNYARNKATNEATKEIESWLSKSGNAKLSINLDKKLSVKNSQLDWLIPWYDQPDTLLFTQHSVHRNDGRLQTNNGIGLRRFYEKNTFGINAFIDHDLSQYHTRAGVGVEYWQDYLKVNANTYFALSSWKSTSELNHDFNAKPANGWDIQAEGWLPAYPHLGGNLKYEQYYGDSVALFGKTKRQKNPKAATIGAHWTPFPLLTLNANHKIGSQGKKETQAKIQFTWTLGKSLAHHLDPTKVAEARRLSGNRYDFVERNNNIILDYQKKTLLHLSLPAKIQGETGQAISLVKSFSSKYPLKQIEWQAPELLAAGGSISSTDQTATVILPTYKTANTAEAAQKLNRYRLQGTAFDTKGNASSIAETLIEITNAGVISISPNDIKSQGKGLANGNDVNSINVVVRDSHGNVIPNAKVVFVLPNALTLAAKKTKTGTETQSKFQRELRKKMHAMKVAKPWEYTATTNSKGEAQVQFTSQVAGTYEVGAYTGSHQPVKAQVVFKSDITEAHIRHFTVTQTGAVADGHSTNSVKVYITDNNGNSITNQEVLFSAPHAKIVDKATTNEDGIVEVTLTSLKAGASEITVSVNHHSETHAVEFVSGEISKISILEVGEVYAGREGRVSFQLLDSQGNPIINANNDVMIIVDKNTELTKIWDIDINKGIYAATLSGQQPGVHKIQIAIGKVTSLERSFTTGEATSVKSITPDGSGQIGALGVIASIEIDINPDRTTFKSGETPLIMVTLKDIFGNAIEDIDFDHIHLGNMKGKDLAWRDDGHSDYALNLSLTTLGDIDITANVNNIFSPRTVLTVMHNNDISKIENITITPNTTTPNAGDKPSIKVELIDKNGNQVKDIQNIEVTIDGNTHTLPVTPNPDGSYTAELPAQQSGNKEMTVSVNGKDSNKETLNVQQPAPVSPNSQGQAGQQGVMDKLDITTGSTSGLKSGDTLEVTVTATDAFGNGITGLDKDNLNLGNLKGDTLNWVDNYDGSYTAQVPLKDLGNIDLTASLNGINSQQTDITVGNATGDNSVQNIVVTPNTTTPNAGDKPSIKVELIDKNGNQVKDIQNIEVTIDGNTHTLPVTPNPDGSYTAELPAQQSGNKEMTVSVNGKDSNKETLNVQQPAPVSPNNQGQTGQQGVVDKLDITTGSTSGLKSGDTLEVTVTATDSFGNGITRLDKDSLNLGNLKGDSLNWTDNGDGSYTAQVPLKDLGNIDLTASINGISSPKTDITVGNATGDSSVQNIVVTPNTTTPNAGDKPTIKVELTDKNGNQVKDIQNIEVTIDGNTHTLPVTPNLDGSYTAELPAQQSGDKQINVSVNGKDSNKETLNIQPPATISPNSQGQAGQQGVVDRLDITTGSTSGLKSGDTLEVTVTATDSFGNGITGLDKNSLNLGNLKGDTLNWVDNNDGSYTAQVPLKDLGNIDLTASINGVASKKTDITVGNATGDNSVQNIVVMPNSKTPNAGDKPTIKVELTDKNGNQVKDIQNIEVTIDGNTHTLPVTPNLDGSYTAELPAQQSGDHRITATVNGQNSTQETLEVKKPAPISPNNSSGTGNRGERGVINNIAIKTSDITNLQSGDKLDITVTIIDSFNNPLTAIDPSNIILDGYKASSLKWLDNGNGTYTTPLLLTQTGTTELVASINGHKSPLLTITVGNTTDINKVANVELEPITPSEAGETQTITVKVTDKHQHPVTTINKMITANINGQSAPIILTESLTQKGTYTGTLPAQKTGKYTVEVTANNKTASKPWDVKTAATITAKEKNGSGTANQRGVVKTVTLVSSPINDLKSGQSLQLTVALKDAFGNPLEGISGASLQLTHQQPSVSSVNWVDLRNGDYTTILPLTKIGQDTLTVKVNQITTSPLNINVGNATGTTQIHKVNIKNIEKPAAGETSAITLVLTDANNQPITGVNNNAVVSINGAEELLKIAETANKGTYIGTLSGQKSGDHKVIVTVGGVKSTESTLTVNAPVPIAISHGGKSGSRGVINRAILVISPTKDLKSGDALTLTATLEDAFGNPLTGIDLTQSLTHKQTGKVTWTVQKDGTYTANLVLTQLGQDHLFITANKIQSPTIAIDVKSQLGINAIHKIDIHDIANAAAGAQSTFTVVLNDDQGNPVNSIQNLDVTLDKQKLPNIPVTQQADGRYSGKLPGQQSGSYNVVISANKLSSTAKTLTVAPPDTVTAAANGSGASDQRGVVSSVELKTATASLVSGDNLLLTVTLKDSFGNPLKGVDSASIVLQHNQQAATVTWIDQNNGSYTTTLPLNELGRNTLKTTVNSKESLPINIDVASPHQVAQVHQLTLEPITSSSAGSAQTITVKAIDANSHGVTQIADDIKVTLNDKSLNLTFVESKTDKGTYTAPLPAQKAGSYLVKVAMNKQEAKETWIVSAATTLKAIHADGSGVQSNAGVVNTVELTTTASSFKSGESVKLTLTLKDAFDNTLNGIEVKNITLAHHQTGANVTWVDNTDGTYTANVDLKILGKDTLTATVNKINSQTIDFEVIKTDDISKVKNVEIVLTPTAIAGMNSTLVVALTDLNHHAVTGIKEVTVQIDKTHSSTIAVAPLDNGHYILTLPAKQSGSYDIVVTANNINSTPKTWIVSNPSTIVAENSDGSGTQGQRGVVANVQFSTVQSGNLQAGSHLILMVMLKDSFNNPLRGIDSNSIAIAHQQSGSATWKDNGDGTYTADLLLSQLGADTLKVTVNSISQSQAIDVKASQGKSAVHKVELKATNKTFKVGDSVELQLTLTDSHGNGVEKVQTSDIQLDHNHVLVTKLTWLEKGAGIYTTTLPLHKQGKNTFVSQVNHQTSAPLAVNVSALTDPTQVKTVELKASTNQLTVGSQTELTLTLTDQWNNGVEGITAKDITINDAHIKKNLTGLSWISKGNGIYTASTAVSIAGIHSLRATVNQIQSHNVLINALPSTNQSHINKVQLTTNLSTITAGSKVTLSLKVTDMDSNPVIHLNNKTITLTDGNHKISTVWDEDNHGLGLYSTNILLSDVKTHNLTAGIGQFTDTASVTVNSPVGKDAVKTITISPVANSDAGQPSSLSVGLTDQYKNPVKNVSNGDITVTINGQKQNSVFMEKNVLNKYIAQLPASKAGRYQIMVEANGQSETVDWNVNSPKEISITSYDKNGLRGSLETISITHSAKNNTANSGDNVTLTVGLKDKFDNKLTGAASSLKLLTNLQSASAWKELSGGLYTQELTMNKLRKQPIQVVVDKALSDKLELNVDPAKGANHVHKTTLETNEDTIEAGHDVLLTLALTDKVNNSVIDVDTNAIQLTNNGKPTTVTWANPQDGLYTTKLRLDTVGNHQFKATVNNQPSRIQTIEVTAPSGQAKVAKAQLASNIASLDAGKDVELTLTLKDQYGNLVIGVNDADITLKDSHTTETIASSNIAWQMTSAGVYKTALPLTKVGKHTLTAALNNITESTQDITVTALKGASNVNEIKLTADNTTISAGESTTLTLTLLDSYGNEVVDVEPKDIQLKNTDSTITTTASWVKDPSHNHVYTAKVTLEKVKRHTLSVDVNSQSKNIAIEVKTLEGAKNVAKIELNMSAAARLGANMPLTLQLKDKFGNGVIYVTSQDIQLTNNGQAENITWTEGSQGQYEANWLSRKVGKHQLDVVVNANRLAKPIDIELAPPQGAKSVDSIGIDMLDTAEVGDTVNVTLKLQDKYSFDVIDISSNDITLLSDKQTLPTLVWSDDKHGNYSTNVKFDTVGKHTLTVNINNSAKITDKKEINIKALPPVFGKGKSEFSVDTDSVEGNGKDKATVTLKLMDKNGTPISGRKPKLTATMGNINSVMDEKSPGEYTSTFNSSTVGTSKLAINSSSINYSGSVPEITIVTYGTPEIQTIGDQSVFAIDSGFPNTGFEGAQFRITVPVGQPTDYSWSVDSDWLSIDDKGVVTMQRKPTTSAMTPTFKGVPKPHTGYKRTVDYRFTLKKWYVRSDQSYNFNRIAARNCVARGARLVKYNDLAEVGAISNRKAGEQLLQEWGATFTLNKLGIIYALWTDDYEHTSTLYSFFKRSSLEHVTLNSSQLRDYAELDILCVNDLN